MANQILRSTVTLKEGSTVEANVRGFKVTIDEPEQMGGANLGMTPTELLLSSLGSCITITISMFAKAFHINIKELSVDIEGDFDPMGVMGKDKDVRIGYSALRLNINIASDAPQHKIDRLIKMAEEKCPVSDTLRLGVPITTNYNVDCEKDHNKTA